MTASEHDRALGVVSHTAQLVASALAAQLPHAGELGPVLAGRGFRDTTRLADSDPALWEQIALANRVSLGESVRGLADELTALADALEQGDAHGVRGVLERGREARTLLPTKTGRSPVRWTRIGVVLQDRPGELARLFAVAGEAGVNIEDVAIDHATDHPVGMVALDVAESAAGVLESAVRNAGWHAVPLV
jgi:prephenate dehydrogenase